MMSVELKRLAHLFNDMQHQNRHTPDTASHFDVVLLICDLVSLIRNQIAKKISLEVEASQSFIVNLPENTLRLVLLNLVLNAAEALDDREAGHICIKVEHTKSGLIIQVIDDGKGFSAEILAHPIPSLRACYQQGLGTGLAMSQGFIKNLGGRLKLQNHLIQGACVTIVLPEKCLIEI